jgi:alkanesulfonate monooxygenase SsuD/methylene tetrahydromethanopterin reductase-like flavin-dependent oxidoreductase (luciferase family)
MRIGLVAGNIDGVADEAAAAEAAGFDFFAAGEHVFFHQPIPNAFVALAAAAASTKTIRLLSSVALLPLYPAALAAKLVTSLDRVSAGRFELGVGAGGEYPPEFVGCGVEHGDRFRRLDEALEIIRALAGGEEVSYTGSFATLEGVRLQPPAVQLPHPPIWVGGRRPGARRRAARFAEVWFPYMMTPEMFAESLGDVHRRARELGREALPTGALFAWLCVDPDGAWARKTGVDTVSAMYAQDFEPLADRYLLVGDPESVVARLHAFGAAGVETVVVAVAAPEADRSRVISSLVGDVLPQCRNS